VHCLIEAADQRVVLRTEIICVSVLKDFLALCTLLPDLYARNYRICPHHLRKPGTLFLVKSKAVSGPPHHTEWIARPTMAASVGATSR
jgi:hypothetical protein